MALHDEHAIRRLNLGGGEIEIDGFENIDRRFGGEVYPLESIADGSIDEIRASHVLEHFSHRITEQVLREWVRVLKPGGLLRVAVPDFQWCSDQMQAGSDAPIEQYVMGGHVDQNDWHGAAFTWPKLCALMEEVGLLGLCRWESEARDCAALEVSLNIQGWKPSAQWPSVSAVMSVPRLGFMDHASCSETALRPLGIRTRHVQGAYWGQCLTRGIEEAIRAGPPDYILTVDYDTLFQRRDVESLISAAERHPEADAIAALQSHRKEPRTLFTIRDSHGDLVTEIDRREFSRELIRVHTAHFGLTLIRVSSLQQASRPWFHSRPDADGGWGDGRLDDDVAFWENWHASALSLYVAARVPVGHAELVVRWPDRSLRVIHQHPSDFQKSGKPEAVWR